MLQLKCALSLTVKFRLALRKERVECFVEVSRSGAIGKAVGFEIDLLVKRVIECISHQAFGSPIGKCRTGSEAARDLHGFRL